jgi:hypothetical protein
MKIGIDRSPVLEIELTTRIASPVAFADTNREFPAPALRMTIPFRVFAEAVELEKFVSLIWPVPELTWANPSHS